MYPMNRKGDDTDKVVKQQNQSACFQLLFFPFPHKPNLANCGFHTNLFFSAELPFRVSSFPAWTIKMSSIILPDTNSPSSNSPAFSSRLIILKFCL